MRLPLLALMLGLSACSSTKLLRLENELLKRQNAELRTELEQSRAQAAPADFATTVDLELVEEYLSRAGLPEPERSPTGLLTVPVEGHHTNFQVTVQLFEREKVLFMNVANYLRLEDAASSQAMVLLLTQLAALNYDLLLGKFQLNPRTGDISLSVELNLDDGLGFQTFSTVIHHLIRTADDKHPDLLRAAQGQAL